MADVMVREHSGMTIEERACFRDTWNGLARDYEAFAQVALQNVRGVNFSDEMGRVVDDAIRVTNHFMRYGFDCEDLEKRFYGFGDGSSEYFNRMSALAGEMALLANFPSLFFATHDPDRLVDHLEGQARIYREMVLDLE